MPKDDFSERAIDSVLIKEFLPLRDADNLEIGGNVMISVTRDDGTPDGPFVDVQLAAEIDQNTSIQAAEIALLDRALQLMRRIGNEDAASLHARWVDWSKRARTGQLDDDDSVS